MRMMFEKNKNKQTKRRCSSMVSHFSFLVKPNKSRLAESEHINSRLAAAFGIYNSNLYMYPLPQWTLFDRIINVNDPNNMWIVLHVCIVCVLFTFESQQRNERKITKSTTQNAQKGNPKRMRNPFSCWLLLVLLCCLECNANKVQYE